MSYARFGWEDSDVYVYLDCGGYLCCCGCFLTPRKPQHFETTADCIAHLEEHRAAGHCVPDSCIAELRVAAEENDARIANFGAAR